jgi:hypothetical protein
MAFLSRLRGGGVLARLAPPSSPLPPLPSPLPLLLRRWQASSSPSPAAAAAAKHAAPTPLPGKPWKEVRVGVLRESPEGGERRVAAVPATVKELAKRGMAVVV